MEQGMTPGPWRLGSYPHGQTVVADSGHGTHGDAANREAYGGALVCESILTEANAMVIAQAPSMLMAIIEVLPLAHGSTRKKLEKSLGGLSLLAPDACRDFLGLPRLATQADVKVIYIAGPMTGLPGYNHKAFDDAAAFYRSQGWYATNPIDLDLKFDGVDIRSLPINHDWDSMPATMNRDDIIRRDFEAVMASDAIALLPGWQESTGANAELRLAVWRGIEVRDFESDREAA